MKWLCVAALLVGLASAKLPQHLSDNKVPTGNDIDYTTTCDECKSIAKRFVDAVHDPAKLAELKIILSALCDETSYVAECKVIVNNLDKIVKKMEPFFADAEKVCKLFHLCSNSNLDKFHRVALLFAKRYINQAEGKNDLACDECIVAAGEVKKVVENVETQKKVKTFISDEVCRHLGAYQGTCDLLIEEFLPELFQELDKVLQDPKAACADVGFCAKPNGVYKKKAQVSRRPVYRLLRKTKELKTSEPQVLAMDCLTCKILVDGIILDLKTNESSYGIGQDIKELACPQLPAEWLEGCDDFLNLYAQTVVSMTVDQFTSEEVCEMLQSCDPSEYRETKAALSAMTKKEIASATCESCKGLSTLVRKEISQPGFAAAFESFFDKFFCQKHVPTTFNPLCENFSRSYVPRLVPHVAKFLEADNLCHC